MEMKRVAIHSDARRPRGGFTLIEATLATLIVGLGVLSMMQLFTACTRQNRAAFDMTTAMLLAQNIQETMADLEFTDPAYGKTYFGPEGSQTLATYDDIDDFNAQTFNPPIDSTRKTIPALSQYAQVISVWPVKPNWLTANLNPSSPDLSQTTYTGAARVTVMIMHRTTSTAPWTEVYRTSWIRVAG
jgi:type II secretory pathway pseudopilin PulG